MRMPRHLVAFGLAGDSGLRIAEAAREANLIGRGKFAGETPRPEN